MFANIFAYTLASCSSLNVVDIVVRYSGRKNKESKVEDQDVEHYSIDDDKE